MNRRKPRSLEDSSAACSKQRDVANKHVVCPSATAALGPSPDFLFKTKGLSHKCFGVRNATATPQGGAFGMQLTTKVTGSSFVPLRDAMVCVACEFITPAGNSKCSVCGQPTLVSLPDLLAVLIEKACNTQVPIPIAELARLVPFSRSPLAESPSQKPI